MDSTITITNITECAISRSSKKVGTQKNFDLDRNLLRERTGGKSDKVNIIGWESLPLLVFRVLFQYIDYETKLQVRQVCSNWLDIVELEVGLSVDVYESDEDNACFINSVKIKELHVKDCFVPQVKRLLQPSEIETLGLYGNTCSHWFHFNMREDFALIKKLILRGKAISYLELGKLLGNNQNLYNTNRVGTPPCLIFDHLEKLEIIADSSSFPMNNAFFFPSVLNPMNQNTARTISVDIAQNICYFLNNIRCKELKAVKIYSSYQEVNVSENLNWKSNPLKRFLEYHAKSLEKLLLPEFSGENENSHSIRNESKNCIPRNLNTLRIYLCCFKNRNRLGGTQNPVYWLIVILNQHQLENLSLELACFPQNFFTPLINSIVCKNHLTLKRIALTYLPAEWTIVNGNAFSSCQLLESLKILKYVDSRPISLERSSFINLSRLPSSLKTLELTGFLIDINCNGVYTFPKLGHLVLQILVADSVSCYQRNIRMISNFLSLRQLNYFDFYIAKPPQALSLTKIKNFVYRSRLFKEHILNTNYISTLSIDYGMQILISSEIATIRYAPSICKMYNPEIEDTPSPFVYAAEENFGIDNNIRNIPVAHDDEHLIALVQHDLAL